MKTEPFAMRLLRALCLIVLLAGWVAPSFAVRDQIRLALQLEPPSLEPTTTAAAVAGEITYCNLFEGLPVLEDVRWVK